MFSCNTSVCSSNGNDRKRTSDKTIDGGVRGVQQANTFCRAGCLASTALRLTHTLSEGVAEGLLNLCDNLYGLLSSAARQQQEPYLEDLTGKVAIVTGGNAGIGFATAQELARRGAHVVLACRDKGRAQAAVQEIAQTLLFRDCHAGRNGRPSATVMSTTTVVPPLQPPPSSPLPRPPPPQLGSPFSSPRSPQHPYVHATTAAACTGPAVSPSVTPDAAAAAAAAAPLRVEAMELDLGRLSNVRRFAEEWRRRGLPLDLLVCNAGVMAPLKKTLTPDGMEVQFQVNFLSHWLLTHLLLDHERQRRRKQKVATAGASSSSGTFGTAGTANGGADSGSGALPAVSSATRVVIVSSVVHRVGLLQWSDMLSERSYEPYITYGMSKLATVIFAKELQRRLDRHPEYGLYDSAVAIHPGIARTNLANGFFRSYGLSWSAGTPLEPLQRLWHSVWDTVGQALLATPLHAAHRMLAASLGPHEQVAGKYMALGRVYPADKASDDTARAAELWAIASRLTGYVPPPSLA